MGSTEQTLNEVENSSTQLDTSTLDPDGRNLFETVEEDAEPSEETQNTEQEEESQEEEKTDRLDKHPRFKEVIEEKNRYKAEAEETRLRTAKLEAELEILKNMMKDKEQVQTPKSKSFVDITQMTEEEITDKLATDPKWFAANLYRQIREEVVSDIRAEEKVAKEQDMTRKTYESYEKENPDFVTMWQKGEIQRFMENNPGHNPISAHMVMTRESRVKEAIEQAKKDAEAEVEKRFKSKQKASVLGTGRAATGRPPIDTTLADTKTHGGFVNVWAEKLRQMRSGANTT